MTIDGVSAVSITCISDIAVLIYLIEILGVER
jgi:hypothetical protein